MLKKLACVAVVGVFLLSAVVANAGVVPDGRLKLTIGADGQAYISNTTTSIIRIESYEISSSKGTLNISPKQQVWSDDDQAFIYVSLFSPSTAWASIEDRIATGNLGALTASPPAGPGIGTNAGGFVEMNNTPNLLTEATPATGGLLIVRPSGSPPIPLGKLENMPLVSGDVLTFVYGIPEAWGGVAGNVYQGQIAVPEPATMCVLAIGGVGMLIRKRRRS